MGVPDHALSLIQTTAGATRLAPQALAAPTPEKGGKRMAQGAGGGHAPKAARLGGGGRGAGDGGAAVERKAESCRRFNSEGMCTKGNACRFTHRCDTCNRVHQEARGCCIAMGK